MRSQCRVFTWTHAGALSEIRAHSSRLFGFKCDLLVRLGAQCVLYCLGSPQRDGADDRHLFVRSPILEQRPQIMGASATRHKSGILLMHIQQKAFETAFSGSRKVAPPPILKLCTLDPYYPDAPTLKPSLILALNKTKDGVIEKVPYAHSAIPAMLERGLAITIQPCLNIATGSACVPGEPAFDPKDHIAFWRDKTAKKISRDSPENYWYQDYRVSRAIWEEAEGFAMIKKAVYDTLVAEGRPEDPAT